MNHQNGREEPDIGNSEHREDKEAPIDVQYGDAHEVHLIEGGELYKLAGRDTVMVNSLHSQGIAKLADGVTVEAVADDGLIEGFRVDSSPGYALAVQWHPEWRVRENAFSMSIFKSFGDAARAYAEENR